jgi:hypothetical protein
MQPANSYQLLTGLTSGSRQRQGLYAHCHFDAIRLKKATDQNDVPQLPYRVPQIR